MWTSSALARQGGFTLIELVIGIVVMAIALVVSISFLSPLARKSIEPIYQVRAAELGYSLMNEIFSKSFDENSDHNGGGQWRCGEQLNGVDQPACTEPSNWGRDGDGDDEEERNAFNDVDDYITAGFVDISDSLNQPGLADLYRGYQYQVAVEELTIDGVVVDSALAKQLLLKIRAPDGSTFAFSLERWNY
ncbi:type IV pilus modification PilV family protein [Aliagarivorans marinus]|uniref:type IV pilus modification PilV family protein n=1 Tax=Aliagarivorans marinus TaxID=561965 RepID=UPI000406909D|nr:prepilin-type N-terminal cleavage/methylation domain-containing protein [Aliagarivorans marinus]